MKNLSLVLIGLVTSTLAYGAGSGAHGGTGVVCFKEDSAFSRQLKVLDEDGLTIRYLPIPDEAVADVESVQMLEMHELGLLNRVDNPRDLVIPMKDGETADDYVDRVITRLAFLLPRVWSLLNYSKAQLGEAGHAPHGFKHVPDYDPTVNVPANCILATIAMQYDTGDVHYWYVDARLLPVMDEFDQAVMLLHERSYLVGRRYYGHVRAGPTRRLVTSLLQPKFGFETDVSLASVMAFYQKLGWGFKTELYGHVLEKDKIELPKRVMSLEKFVQSDEKLRDLESHRERTVWTMIEETGMSATCSNHYSGRVYDEDKIKRDGKEINFISKFVKFQDLISVASFGECIKNIGVRLLC